MDSSHSAHTSCSEQSSEVSSSQNDSAPKSEAGPSGCSSSSVRIAPAESSDAVQENSDNATREAKPVSSSFPAPSRMALRSTFNPSTFSSSSAESSDASQENSDNSSREAKSVSSSFSAPSKMAFRSTVFAPASFSSSSAQPDSSPTKPFTLNPPKLSNPFAKIPTDDDDEKDNNGDITPKNESPKKPNSSSEAKPLSFVPLAGGKPGSSASAGFSPALPTSSFVFGQNLTDKINSNSASSSGSSSNNEAKAVSFVPLAGSSSSRPGSSLPTTTFGSAPQTSSFVFGQNLRDKIEAPQPSDEVSSSNNNVHPSSNGTSSSSSGGLGRLSGSTDETPKANGTASAEMLFTSAVKGEVAETTTAPPECDGAAGGAKSLSEAAKEYEESRQVKRKFEAVPVITGEENEFNVLQMNCKLLAYDKGTPGWQERGRGTLRLNDSFPPSSTSRLIVRAAGSLRLLLNTQIWGGMCVQRANSKSIRFTAVDSSGEMRIFVVMATVKEMDQLERSLEARVKLAPDTAKRPRMESAR